MTDFEISPFQKGVQTSIATEAEFKPVRGDPYRFEDGLPGDRGLDPLPHGIPRMGPRRRGPADGRARGPAVGGGREGPIPPESQHLVKFSNFHKNQYFSKNSRNFIKF